MIDCGAVVQEGTDGFCLVVRINKQCLVDARVFRSQHFQVLFVVFYAEILRQHLTDCLAAAAVFTIDCYDVVHAHSPK